MGKTLYVSDLDGTLLNGQEQVPAFSRRVINRLAERGVAFTYATARSQHSADRVTQGLTKSLPVIVYNGTFIRRGERRETLLGRDIPPDTRRRVGAVFAEAGLSPLVYTMVQGVERVLWRPDRETAGVARYVSTRKGDERLLPVEDDGALYQGGVFYYTCIGEREELRPAYEALKEDPALSVLFQEEIYRPGEFWLEIAHRDATKAHAAAWLKDYLGCDEMVAFGDGLNDLPLFAAADRRCAVANAVPALREAADQVIPKNEENGVARFLLADTAPALALGERAGAFSLGLYRPGDLEGLIRLFYETVHTVNPRDYTKEQVDAWAPSPEGVDREAWGQSLAAHYTLVARRGGEIVGFGDMDPTGYLDRLYVHKDFQGRGVASALAEALEGYAYGLGVEKITVHASRTARPFFEKRGYRVLFAQQVERRGVLLENFAMEKALG